MMQKMTQQNASSWNITLYNLSVGYNERLVLEDITTVLPEGQISVILGESGCGKSTLLRHIIGLSRPQKGRVFYGENDLFALSDHAFRRLRRRFGVLFQDGALLGSLTLAQNVGLPLHEHTKLRPDDINEVVLRALALVGLEEYTDYYPNELSGGMKKRGGLARAIITEPPVLFCDEPTSGLDPINAAQMDQLLLDMKTAYPGMTLVVVTHDLASVQRIADHVVVLREGRLVFADTVDALNTSNDPYLRQFMDRLPENETRLLETAMAPHVRKALDHWLEN